MNFTHRHLSSEKGFALVLTLLILVLITAMVVEFAYGVYTSTSALHNWKEAQKLSFVSKSGVSLAVKTMLDPQIDLRKFPGRMDIPVENILEGYEGTTTITAEDENAKFNLNSLVGQNGEDSKTAIPIFRNLLRNLGLDENIADRVADWIDKNSEPRLAGSEEGAKNGYMDSVDELLLIRGIDQQTYEKLSPYVTVYGLVNDYDNYVNINTASIPVIMSLNISESLAERIVMERKLEPFASSGDFISRTGSSVGSAYFIFKPKYVRITASSEENGIRRVIESVVSVEDQKVRYWREM